MEANVPRGGHLYQHSSLAPNPLPQPTTTATVAWSMSSSICTASKDSCRMRLPAQYSSLWQVRLHSDPMTTLLKLFVTSLFGKYLQWHLSLYYSSIVVEQQVSHTYFLGIWHHNKLSCKCSAWCILTYESDHPCVLLLRTCTMPHTQNLYLWGLGTRLGYTKPSHTSTISLTRPPTSPHPPVHHHMTWDWFTRWEEVTLHVMWHKLHNLNSKHLQHIIKHLYR